MAIEMPSRAFAPSLESLRSVLVEPVNEIIDLALFVREAALELRRDALVHVRLWPPAAPLPPTPGGVAIRRFQRPGSFFCDAPEGRHVEAGEPRDSTGRSSITGRVAARIEDFLGFYFCDFSHKA